MFDINNYEIYNDGSENLKPDTIYKAKDLNDNTDVCIKILPKSKYIKDKFLANLIDANTEGFNFSCNNLAEILHIDDDEKNYFIISEYFEGKTLKNLIDNRKLKIESIRFIFKQIITCMRLCDKDGKYHGSLRLDNILVDEDYNVKIYDFDITSSNKGVNIRANEDSLYYLSPHQININYTDRESDFFSLGVILYYFLFKKFPFEKAKTERDMLKNIDKGVDFNKERITVVNKGLAEISRKLLSRTDKYKNYDEILEDLSKVIYRDIERKKDTESYNNSKGSIFENSFIVKTLIIALCVIMLIMMIL